MVFKFNKASGYVDISMPGYVSDIIKKYNITGTACTPGANNFLAVDNDSPAVNKTLYLSMLQSLNYVSFIRPSIKFHVSYLATVSNPTQHHMQRLLRIYRYLNGTLNHGLRLSPKDYRVFAFADASYAIHPDSRSHGGLHINLGPGTSCPILVESFKLKSVATSSTEAELVVLMSATQFIQWYARILNFLGIHSCGPATVYQDNKSAICMAKTGRGDFKRTKHFEVRYQYIKERIDSKLLSVKYIPSEHMSADLLTKPLVGKLFYTHCASLESPFDSTPSV